MNNAANASRKVAMSKPTNVVVAGLGGQGVLKGTDILANVALRAGFDVKKSELKGMSQRGGSVSGDIRFGHQVFSPMVPVGEADFLLVLEPTQVTPNQHLLKPGGLLITPDAIDAERLPTRKALNVALLGALSAHLPMEEKYWLECLEVAFEHRFFAGNKEAFLIGRASQQAASPR